MSSKPGMPKVKRNTANSSSLSSPIHQGCMVQLYRTSTSSNASPAFGTKDRREVFLLRLQGFLVVGSLFRTLCLRLAEGAQGVQIQVQPAISAWIGSMPRFQGSVSFKRHLLCLACRPTEFRICATAGNAVWDTWFQSRGCKQQTVKCMLCQVPAFEDRIPFIEQE